VLIKKLISEKGLGTTQPSITVIIGGSFLGGKSAVA